MSPATSTSIELLTKILPLLIPVLILQIALMVIALVDLIKREKTRGPKWLWGIIIVFGELLGPIVYLIFGRVE